MNTKHLFRVIALSAFAVAAGLFQASAEHHNVVSDSETYTLSTCPVSGQALGSMGDPVIETISGREVRFCCAGCVGPYREKTDEYDEKISAAIIEQQKDAYPTDRCVVMDTVLGSMGEPVNHVYKNRLVRFCCAGCTGMFNSDPDKYLAKLDAAILEKGPGDDAPETCAVTGEPLGDAPVKLILANQLLLLHSEACVDEVRKNPAKYLDK